MKKLEMVIYCIIYPILTLVYFMIWYFQTSLTGENIGLAPVFLGLVLFGTFILSIILVVTLRKKINRLKHKIFSLFVVFLLYEGVFWFFKGHVPIFEAFRMPFVVNLDMAFSLSSILALLSISGIMVMNRNIRFRLSN